MSLPVIRGNISFEAPPSEQHEGPATEHESAQIDIHVLSPKEEAFKQSGSAALAVKEPSVSNHRRRIFKVVSSELQQCIESTIQSRLDSPTPITCLRIVTHKGVPEITLHIDAKHVCSAPTGVADIRLKAMGPCVLSLASTVLGVPLWEWAEVRDRVRCNCAVQHVVGIDGFDRPMPYYGLRYYPRPPRAGGSIRASLRTYHSVRAMESVLSLAHSVSTLDTVSPPVCVPEPRDFTAGGDSTDNEIIQTFASVSIEHTAKLSGMDAWTSLPPSDQTAPPKLRIISPDITTAPAWPLVRKWSHPLDFISRVEDMTAEEKSDQHKPPLPEAADTQTKPISPAPFRDYSAVAPATTLKPDKMLPVYGTDNEEPSMSDGSSHTPFGADDVGSSACSTVVPDSLTSPPPIAASMDSLLFMAYLSGVVHAFQHASQSYGPAQPLPTQIQGCFCIPDPPEVGLSEYMMDVFLSAASRASQEDGKHDSSAKQATSRDTKGKAVVRPGGAM